MALQKDFNTFYTSFGKSSPHSDPSPPNRLTFVVSSDLGQALPGKGDVPFARNKVTLQDATYTDNKKETYG